MPNVLRDLKIVEVSSVDRGAGDGVKIMLMKRTAVEETSRADTARGHDRARRHAALAESAMDEDDDETTEATMKAETIRKATELAGDDKIEFMHKAVAGKQMDVASVDAVTKAYVRASMRKDESEARASGRLASTDPVFNKLLGLRRDALYVGSI